MTNGRQFGEFLMLETVPFLAATNLHKTYRKDAVEVRVLQGLDLEVYPGEVLSVVGASGCGKSTLLHLLGTIDKPDKGEIRLQGAPLDILRSDRRARLPHHPFVFLLHT